MKVVSTLQQGRVQTQNISGRIASTAQLGMILTSVITGSESGGGGNFILMESSDYILMEDGSKIIMEA